MATEEFLAIGEVAKLLGVTPQAIRRWQKEGKIQETRSPTDRRLYRVREVKRIMGVRTHHGSAYTGTSRDLRQSVIC
jgi:excisionase family DNA binding protein